VVEKLEDILTRFGDKVAGGDKNTAGGGGAPRLLPERHPTRDFFVADILDWALKDDFHSMEHPIFSLSKTPDHKERHYERNGSSITIKPGSDGLATIWDKDILIFCISQLTEAINQGRPVTRTVRLKAYDILVTTNRHTGGEHYKRLEAAFDRLAGTRIKTNITTNRVRIREGFGLIDNWKIIERAPGDGRMVAVSVTLNEWLYNAVLGREVLTLHRDYFRLDGGLQRRLYEIGRKHCGKQAQWIISLELLHTKTGSTASLKKFRQLLKAATASNQLPDYNISYDPTTDRVIFEHPKKTMGLSGTAKGPSGTILTGS
jgi:plasmid replication initiation protein